MSKAAKILAVTGAASVFALTVGSRQIEVEREVTGNPALAEIGCIGFDFVTFQPSEKDPACDDNQQWISVLSVSGKGFDISRGFNIESIRANAPQPVSVQYADTLWNAALDRLPERAQVLKTETDFYPVPIDISFDHN